VQQKCNRNVAKMQRTFSTLLLLRGDFAFATHSFFLHNLCISNTFFVVGLLSAAVLGRQH
jgi:hypothetical protein